MRKLSRSHLFPSLVVLVILLHPFLYLQMYAGDAELHLVFGRNAAHGHFFEFNVGEKSPGTTSPGYMLLLAALFRLFPETIVPALVKAINILCWYALLTVLFLLARRVLGNETWALATVLVASLLPGSIYNSTVGMENGIFAFLVLLWIYAAVRLRWFEVPVALDVKGELVLGTLLGVLCWLRPEAFVLCAVALAYRVFSARKSALSVRRAFRAALLFLISFLPLAALLIYFQYSLTGFLLSSSGMARVANSWQGAFVFGPVSFDPKFVVRLVFYFPLTIFWLIGNWLIVTRRTPAREQRCEIFLLIVFWVFFFLYSTLLGAAHLARYTIFTMALLVLVAMRGAMWVWHNWQTLLPMRAYLLRGLIYGGMALALCTIFLFETRQRLQLGPRTELAHVMRAPLERQAYSDQLLAELGAPSWRPVSLAFQEIQARYWLDERFVVRALDGRTDPVLLRHIKQGNYDHLGYIKERHIDFVMETPNYNRDPEVWSLEQLNRLRAGEAATYEGLKFSRLPNIEVFRVEPEK